MDEKEEIELIGGPLDGRVYKIKVRVPPLEFIGVITSEFEDGKAIWYRREGSKRLAIA